MAVSPSSSSMEATTAMKQPQPEVSASQGIEPATSQSQLMAPAQLVAPFSSVPQQQQANNNNNNHNAFATPPPPGIMQPYAQIGPPRGSVQPLQVAPIPFYRPLGAPALASAVQNPSALQPPGVSSASVPQTLSQTPQTPQQHQQHNPQTLGPSNPHNQVLGFGQQVPPGAPVSSTIPVSPVRPPGMFPVSAQPQYQQQPPRPYPTTPNGYSHMPLTGPPGTQPQQQPQMMNPSVSEFYGESLERAPLQLVKEPSTSSLVICQISKEERGAVPTPLAVSSCLQCLKASPHSMPRYSAPYSPMVRPTFPPRPPGTMGVMPLSRPPIPGVRAVPPVLKFPPPVTASDPASKGGIPIIPLTEKPQTTVYVGKISPTVENEFLLSLLELCGPIKSWKRAQDPTNGTPKGFGFCEFESAEGVLRALRLLNKFSLEGQELVLNVNQATREYLERFVEKKSERDKQIKEAELQDADKEEETAPGVEKQEPPRSLAIGVLKKDSNDSADQGNQDGGKKFGIVNDADREADEEALSKLTNMLEERAKLKPLPPPPPLHAGSDAPGKSISTSEAPARSRDADSDVEIIKSDIHDDKNEDDTASENKPTSEHERPETSSSDRGRHYARSRERDSDRSRERDRERDLKREKERELERYERERERERIRREREREMRIREVERLYEEREREWEARERDKERQRQYEREREKERERERRREIKEQEEESDDEDWRKRRHRSSMYEEKRKRRQREKEDDLFDQLREEQEIAEAKKRKCEDNRQEEDSETMLLSDRHESAALPVDEVMIDHDHKRSPMDQGYGSDSGEGYHQAEASLGNGNASVSGDEAAMEQIPDTDSRQNIGAPTRKLGFGLIGSGKRTAVPSVFHQEDDEDIHKEKKMRPLVPIDYSAEEMQAVSATPPPGTVPNLVASAELAKRLSAAGSKERVDHEKDRSRRHSPEKDRSRKQSDRSGQKERESNDNDSNRSREESKARNRERDRSREKYHERDDAMEKSKALENKKLLDAKQLIDTIPKTKEALFAYNIDWAIYDQHDLHERMRPWISKKITEFLGEEETTLVDFVVSKTKKHVAAAHMLELLESILDEEAEMFVLKMWRMLIFEIKKVETGLASKAKT